MHVSLNQLYGDPDIFRIRTYRDYGDGDVVLLNDENVSEKVLPRLLERNPSQFLDDRDCHHEITCRTHNEEFLRPFLGDDTVLLGIPGYVGVHGVEGGICVILRTEKTPDGLFDRLIRCCEDCEYDLLDIGPFKSFNGKDMT